MRTTSGASGSSIRVTIAILGREAIEYTIPKDLTIREAFEHIGLQDSFADNVYLSGEKVDADRNILENGDRLQVVTSKDAGSDESDDSENTEEEGAN